MMLTALAVLFVVGGTCLVLRGRTGAGTTAPRDARSSVADSSTKRPLPRSSKPAKKGVPEPMVTSKHPDPTDRPSGRPAVPRTRPSTTFPNMPPTGLPDPRDHDPYDGHHGGRHDPPPWHRHH